MDQSDLPPLYFQNALISSGFNSGLLTLMMIGIYTCVYAGTMVIYLRSKISGSFVVLSSITILYLVALVSAALQWLIVTEIFQLIGQPTIAVFSLSVSPGKWFGLVLNGSIIITSMAADILLVWRCYHAWNRSVRAIAVSLALLIGETACCVTFMIATGLNNGRLSEKTLLSIEDVFAASGFLTFSTTLWTTTLIVYRIASHLHGNHTLHPSKKHRHFRRIVDVVVQSSVIYSIMTLLLAITNLMFGVQAQTSDSVPWNILSEYLTALFCPVSGMVATLMVARVAHASNQVQNNPTTVDIQSTLIN